MDPIPPSPTCRITLLGTATVLLEIGALRFLTDPVFDPPGGKYSFGWGTGSTKLAAPALPTDALGKIDAVLLSHDQHDDNLDRAGRAFLPHANRVLTTAEGARRLRGNALGLHEWASVELQGQDGSRVRVTATPARHGPPLSRPIVGHVIGFVLEWTGQKHGALYISGDTVMFHGIEQVAQRFKIGTALLHLGGVGFTLTGPIRLTMNGAEGVRAAQTLQAQTIIPIHYEGWAHFREARATSEQAFVQAGLASRVRWLPIGEPTQIET